MLCRFKFDSTELTRTECFKLFVVKGVSSRLANKDELSTYRTYNNLTIGYNDLSLEDIEFTEGFTASELLEIFDFLTSLRNELIHDEDKFVKSLLSALQVGLSLNDFMMINVIIPALKSYFLKQEVAGTQAQLDSVVSDIRSLLKADKITLVDNSPESLKNAFSKFVRLNHSDKLTKKSENEVKRRTEAFIKFTKLYTKFLNLIEGSSEYANFGMDYFIKLLEEQYNETSNISIFRGTNEDRLARFSILEQGTADMLSSIKVEVNLDDVEVILRHRVTKEQVKMLSMHLRAGLCIASLLCWDYPGAALMTAIGIATPSLDKLYQYTRASPFKHSVYDAFYDASIYCRSRTKTLAMVTYSLPLYFYTLGITTVILGADYSALACIHKTYYPILLDATLITIYALYTTAKHGYKCVELGDFFYNGADYDYILPKTFVDRGDPCPNWRFIDKPEDKLKPLVKYLIPLASLMVNSATVAEVFGFDSSNAANILPYITSHPIASIVTAGLFTAPCSVLYMHYPCSHWIADVSMQFMLLGSAGYALETTGVMSSVGLYNLSAFPLSTKFFAMEIALTALCGISVYVFSKEYYKNPRDAFDLVV